MRFLRHSCFVASLLVAQVATAAWNNDDSTNLRKIESYQNNIKNVVSGDSGYSLSQVLYLIRSQYMEDSSSANTSHWVSPNTSNPFDSSNIPNYTFVSAFNLLLNMLGGDFMTRGFYDSGVGRGSDWSELVGRNTTNPSQDASYLHRNLFSILADSWAMMHNFTEKDFRSLIVAGTSPNYYYYMSQTLTNLLASVDYSTTDDSFRDNPKTILDFLDCFYTSATNYYERQLALSQQISLGASGAAFNTTNIFVYNSLSIAGYETGEDLLNNYDADAASGLWPSPMNYWYGFYSPAMWQAMFAFDGVYVDRINRQDGNFATSLQRLGVLSNSELNSLLNTMNNFDNIGFVFDQATYGDYLPLVSDLSASRYALYGTANFRDVLNTNVFFTPSQKGRLLKVLQTNEVDEITTAASDSLVDYAKKTNLLTKVDVGQYEEVFDDRLSSLKTYADEIDGLSDFSAFDLFDETLQDEADKLDGFKLGSRSDVLYFNWRPDVGNSSSPPPSTVEIVDFSEVPDWWITFKSQYSPWVFGLLKVCVVLGVIYKCYGKIGELVPS